MRAASLTERDLPRIRQLLSEGYSYREIAPLMGMRDHHSISKFVARYAPELRRLGGGIDPTENDLGVADVRPMRLLVLDIETMANLAWVWDTWKQDIAPSQIVKHKRAISTAWKWYNDDEMYFASEFHDGRETFVRRVWDVLNEADGLIGYNSKRFDIKHLNTEFAVESLRPYAPLHHIDLMATIKNNFLFGSNKLEAVASRLGIGHKREHEGFGLWIKCEAGDADAWARMKDYNENDVRLTERLYTRILPWIINHPSYAAFSRAEVPMCPNCGYGAEPGHPLRQHDWHYARTRRYARYHCPRCGKWSRDRHAEQITETTETSSY